MKIQTRLVQADDDERMARYYFENKAHFKPWEPKRDASFYRKESWKQRVRYCLEAQAQKQSAHFISLSPATGTVIAHCTLSQINFGVFQACNMGYGVASDVEGSGIAYSTCKTAIMYAFDDLGLHRIMANYMPHNNRSGRLLARLGFAKEGLARNYLKIAGKWENHILCSLTSARR